MCCFGQKAFEVAVQLSHDHVCELLAGLVEAQTSGRVDETPELLQLLPRQPAQIQLHNEIKYIEMCFFILKIKRSGGKEL